MRSSSKIGHRRVFLPYDVASGVCVAMWEADRDDSLTIVSGKVSVLADLGRAKTDATQGTAGFRPAYEATGLAGKPSFLIDANLSNILRCDALASFISGTGKPFTAICSVQNVAVNRMGSLLGFNNAGNSAVFRLRVATTTGKMGAVKIRDDGGASSTQTTTQDATTNPQIISFVHTGTQTSIFQNGAATSVSGNTQNPGATTLTQCGIGSATDADVAISRFGRIYFFTGALSTNDRKLMEKRLSVFYGIAVS